MYTLSLKSLSGLSSVFYKTTLITGGVGGAVAGPPTSKLGTILLWSWTLSKYADYFKQFSNKWSFGRKSETSRPPFFEAK